MSLRLRVLAALVLIATVFGIGAYTLAQTTRTNLQAQLDAQLDSAAELVANFNFSGPSSGNQQGNDEIRRLSTLYLGYVTTDGTVETLFVPDFTDATAALPVIDADQARREASHDGTFTVTSTATGVRYRVHAVSTGRQEVVLVALPLDSVDEAVSRLITLELIVSGISGAVLVLVGWWVIHLGVRPLKSMASAASAIAAGDLSARIPEAHPATEAGELGVALNTMLSRIEVAFDERASAQHRLQQFVADASHELRTPVATIRGYAELYRRGALGTSAAVADAMRRTEQEAVRMGELVDDLLLLAKLDEQRPIERGIVDLTALAMDAARDAHAVDPSRSVQVLGDPVVTVTGDENRLRQVIANVVANAIVHTPAGTPIEIVARCPAVGNPGGHAASDVAVLAVVDHGDGIPTELANSVFGRFVRADPSRSRHRGGSGLGLAIVQAIVRAHAGAVTVTPTTGGGATVVITLPAVETPAEAAQDAAVIR